MTSTDPIADYLTRIRNAIRAGHKKVEVPASNLKRELSNVLRQYKFIDGYSEVKDSLPNILRIQLKFSDVENCAEVTQLFTITKHKPYTSMVHKLPMIQKKSCHCNCRG